VIGQILRLGVVQRDAQAAAGLGEVPAHEIGRVADVVALGAAPALAGLVFLPGAVQRLAVAVGGALPPHRDHAQGKAVRRAGVADELGFLVDRRHLHMHRHAPLALGRLHRAQVLRPFAQDRAGIVQLPRGAE
jgi:hypothetical protein